MNMDPAWIQTVREMLQSLRAKAVSPPTHTLCSSFLRIMDKLMGSGFS